MNFPFIIKTNSEVPCCEGFCMSTEEKPTEGIDSGSMLTEIDTGKVYCFALQNKTWYHWLTLKAEDAEALSTLSMPTQQLGGLERQDGLKPGIIDTPAELSAIEQDADTEGTVEQGEE